MQKSYTILMIMIVIVWTLFYFDYKSISHISLLPENHPEVIAVEKLIDKTSSNVSDTTKKKIALAIVSNGKFYSIPYKHLVAIALVESNYKPDMINKSGDYGVMQVNWQWWGKKFVKEPNDLLNVYKNVEIACKIINENKKMGFNQLADYHSFNLERKKDYQEKLKIALRRL